MKLLCTDPNIYTTNEAPTTDEDRAAMKSLEWLREQYIERRKPDYDVAFQRTETGAVLLRTRALNETIWARCDYADSLDAAVRDARAFLSGDIARRRALLSDAPEEWRDTFYDFTRAVRAEVARQDIQFAECRQPSTPAARAAVLASEVGSLAQTALKSGKDTEELAALACVSSAAFRMSRLIGLAGANAEYSAQVTSDAVARAKGKGGLFIFHIEARDAVGDDSFDQHVVIAPDEASARALCPCSDECPGVRGTDHPCFWRNPADSSCTCLGVAGPQGPDPSYDRPGVVCSSFRAG